MDDVIEFIISEDNKGEEVSLEKMDLKSSVRLLNIFNSLVEIMKYEKSLDLKISIEEGSQKLLLGGSNPSSINILENNFYYAFKDHKDRKNVYVNSVNTIYENLNQFNFTIKLKSKGGEKDLRPYFSKRSKIRRITSKDENNLSLHFVKGNFFKLGGINPTIKLRAYKYDYTISCSKQQGERLKSLLFTDISICISSITAIDGKTKYRFKDIYVGNDLILFEEFKQFYLELLSLDEMESFGLISNKMMEYYSQGEFNKAKKIINLFIDEGSSVLYLRTILLVSTPFKENEEMRFYLSKIEHLLTKKIGKIY